MPIDLKYRNGYQLVFDDPSSIYQSYQSDILQPAFAIKIIHAN